MRVMLSYTVAQYIAKGESIQASADLGMDLFQEKTGSEAGLIALNAKGEWSKSAELSYRYEGQELMIEVPRKYLESTAFDFHWTDNVPVSGEIADFFLQGDNAPERRSNYRFQE